QCVGKLLANREGAVRQPLTRRETALDKRRRGYALAAVLHGAFFSLGEKYLRSRMKGAFGSRQSGSRSPAESPAIPATAPSSAYNRSSSRLSMYRSSSFSAQGSTHFRLPSNSFLRNSR